MLYEVPQMLPCLWVPHQLQLRLKEKQCLHTSHALFRNGEDLLACCFSRCHANGTLLSGSGPACRVLNRTLVLPQFVAWCDSDHNADVLATCAMVGSDLQLPFNCTADFYINVRKLESSPLRVRESSFFTKVSGAGSLQPVFLLLHSLNHQVLPYKGARCAEWTNHQWMLYSWQHLSAHATAL